MPTSAAVTREAALMMRSPFAAMEPRRAGGRRGARRCCACSPWQRSSGTRRRGRSAETRETLAVGFLPVTCHLTCPVTDYASKTSRTTRFESQRFTDFPTVVETMKSGRLDATFMIAPLAMKLREQGVPVRIVYLGHRDGSTVIVRKDLPAQVAEGPEGQDLRDSEQVQQPVPGDPQADEGRGRGPADIRFVEMPPPDMPGALASKAIDAYFVGEPHAARAELDGTGRVLYYAKDIWPHFISCVLVVTEQADRRAPGRGARPGARHRRERRVGRDASRGRREGRLALLPPGRDAGALRAHPAAGPGQLPDADARETTRCSGSPTWRSRPASSSGAST